VLFLAVLAIGEGFFSSPPRFTTSGWLAIFFIGASSGIGTYLWLWALGNTTPTRVTVFLALSPLTAASLGILFLAEKVSFLLVLGIGSVTLGLWLVHRR
jgi:drug/metabolite transporter (DMT)-like permease